MFNASCQSSLCCLVVHFVVSTSRFLSLSWRPISRRYMFPSFVASCTSSSRRTSLSSFVTIYRIMPPFVPSCRLSSRRMSHRLGACLFVAAHVSLSRRMSLRRSLCLFVAAHVSSSQRMSLHRGVAFSRQK